MSARGTVFLSGAGESPPVGDNPHCDYAPTSTRGRKDPRRLNRTYQSMWKTPASGRLAQLFETAPL